MAEIQLRPCVQKFAQEMERKLRANDHKTHWLGSETKYLSRRLTEECSELRRAIRRGNADETLAEAADVANFAMMLADKAGALT